MGSSPKEIWGPHRTEFSSHVHSNEEEPPLLFFDQCAPPVPSSERSEPRDLDQGLTWLKGLSTLRDGLLDHNNGVGNHRIWG